MTTLSRAALHAQVWAEPMTQLAPKYGLTPATLKTICERYDVPTPRGGFWQKKSVGRAPPARALSDEAWSTDHEIDLSAPPPKAARPAPRAMTPRPSSIEALTAPKPKPAVQPRWTPVDNEPAAVRSLRKALDKAKATDLGFLHVHGRGLIPATLSDPTRERALAWLSRFLTAAAARRMELQTHDNAPCLVVDGQAIPFKLEEKSDKHAHTPTPAELRRKAEREEWSWGAHLADPWPKYDHYPSGRLSIQLEGNLYSGVRRSFADGKSRTLEALTEDVLDAVSAHAAYRIARDRQARIAQRRAETEHRRRAQREAFGGREQRREAFIDLMAQALDNRARYQRLLDHIAGWSEAKNGPPGLTAYLERRMAQEEARLDANALALSARSAKLEFDEVRARAAPPIPIWHYPSALGLDLWLQQGEQAVAVKPLDWLESVGRLPPFEDLEDQDQPE